MDVSLDGDLECLNWVGADVGGLDEATTWSREVEVLVSLLAVIAMICQFKCTEVRQWSKWTSHEERCGRNNGSLEDSRMAFEVRVEKKKDQTGGRAGEVDTDISKVIACASVMQGPLRINGGARVDSRSSGSLE